MFGAIFFELQEGSLDSQEILDPPFESLEYSINPQFSLGPI